MTVIQVISRNHVGVPTSDASRCRADNVMGETGEDFSPHDILSPLSSFHFSIFSRDGSVRKSSLFSQLCIKKNKHTNLTTVVPGNQGGGDHQGLGSAVKGKGHSHVGGKPLLSPHSLLA